jgi:hypothetical protein
MGGYKKYHRLGFAVMTTCVPTLVLGAEKITVADNDQVLRTWQQAAGPGQTPELVKQQDGSTKIEWKGGVSLDIYHNSPTGNTTLTPQREGDFYKLQAQGDLRGTDPNGTSYAQISYTATDDRAVLSQARSQINSLQFGRVGAGYGVMAGDVLPAFSNLGTNTGIRGMLGQKQFGQTTISGAAGVIAPSWEILSGRVDRPQPLRDAYAAKVEHQFTPSTRAYVTTQAYKDEANTIDPAATALPLATAHTHTVGFGFQEGQFNLAGEAGTSRWGDDTGTGVHGNAQLLDATYRFQTVGLRGGYHNLDRGYASLSSSATPGIKEGYVGGDWVAANWVTLSSDLRRSESTVILDLPKQTTDSINNRAVINFGPSHPGWGLLLQQSYSRTDLGDPNRGRNQNNGATLSYSDQTWTTGVGVSELRVKNSLASATDGKIDSLNFNVGRMFSDAAAGIAPSWTMSVNFAVSLQDQKLTAGGGSKNTVYSLGTAMQRQGWGALNLAYTDGDIKQTPTGTFVKQKGVQFDVSKPLGGQNLVKFYVRNNKNTSNDTNLEYREHTVGLQAVYIW